MEVIPVLDLMEGKVVRGVGGRRAEYQPIESEIAANPQPATIAQAFSELGLSSCYIADLDAIGGQLPAWEVYRTLLAKGFKLFIDAGISDGGRARELADFRAGPSLIDGVIVGLETLPAPKLLAQLSALLGPRMVFSLDLRGGQPQAGPDWGGFSPRDMLDAALDAGVLRFIILDLAEVGAGGGVGTEEYVRWLRQRGPHVQITAGGGVRDISDVQALAAWGCDAALVASALHEQWITAADLSTLARRM
jgi:phosphoribosylformimino-5-aminoimidazole carboxamide ribotide isomerase